MKRKTYKRIASNILGLVFVFLAMAAAALMRDGSVLGHDFTVSDADKAAQTVNPDGSVTINTTEAGKDISGYSGPVPVSIVISEGIVSNVTPLDNNETPGFFKRVIASGILDTWNGKTVAEALDTEVDAVSGATYSSSALIENVRAGLRIYSDMSVSTQERKPVRGVAFYIALIVTLAGAAVPLFVKDKKYRLCQQILNVAVLGFWAGTFVDYTAILGLISRGTGASATAVTIIMFVTAFIYPLFGRENHYCLYICPLGSLQELAGRCNPHHRIHLSDDLVKSLRRFRVVLWAALMFCLWTGFLTSWIDYELFTAFMVDEAATAVVIAGIAFVLLSLFIPRPYCRFVCPTGTLFRVSENPDNK